jgi:hypothetical protein
MIKMHRKENKGEKPKDLKIILSQQKKEILQTDNIL